MSDYEYHYGKLRLLPKLENETLESQCERICLEKQIGVNYGDSCLETLEEYRHLYIHSGDNLYEIFEHIESNDQDSEMRIFPNSDGTLTFVGQFYNGGTYLGEMLDDALTDYNQ